MTTNNETINAIHQYLNDTIPPPHKATLRPDNSLKTPYILITNPNDTNYGSTNIVLKDTTLHITWSHYTTITTIDLNHPNSLDDLINTIRPRIWG